MIPVCQHYSAQWRSLNCCTSDCLNNMGCATLNLNTWRSAPTLSSTVCTHVPVAAKCCQQSKSEIHKTHTLAHLSARVSAIVSRTRKRHANPGLLSLLFQQVFTRETADVLEVRKWGTNRKFSEISHTSRLPSCGRCPGSPSKHVGWRWCLKHSAIKTRNDSQSSNATFVWGKRKKLSPERTAIIYLCLKLPIKECKLRRRAMNRFLARQR